jgi:hypothetical protein
MRYLKIFLFALAIIFLALNFIHYNIVEEHSGPPSVFLEKYNPALLRLNTLQKLEAYVDSMAKGVETGSLDYAIIAKNVISERFYHKYSTQDLNENWIASVAQKITGYYLSSKITANDILTKPYGYCGQQNMVLFELLQKKGLNCRVVYLPRHFAIQSYINGKWCFFDSNMEPDIPKQNRSNLSWLNNLDSLSVAYRKDKTFMAEAFGNPVQFRYGEVNQKQGINAQRFQKITKYLSRIAFVFPLLCIVYLGRNKTKQVDPRNTK